MKTTGCTVVADGWDDKQRRPLINLMAVTPQGAMFLKAIDTSGNYKCAEYLANSIQQGIMEVGVRNCVQVVTDNAPACISAGRILESRIPHLTASPCVAHSIELFLEDIGKLGPVQELVKNAKHICKTICNHHATDALFKSHSAKRLLRPGDTRFATVFIMMQRLKEVKRELQRCVTDIVWETYYNRYVESYASHFLTFSF